MLQLRQISKRFGETTAIERLDLEVQRGQTTVLLGPSGCGKSTLLRLIIGLVQPDEGSVMFDGQPISKSNIRQLRHRMGYVIQDGGLFPHLTVGSNVTLLARHLGWSDEQISKRLKTLLALTHLSPEMLNRLPGRLSGGQQQRVSLMRALFLDPDVLLLDEPLGALDPMIRSELQAELRTIFRRLAKTVVLVTHDVGEAAYLGDTIVLMRSGRIVQQGGLEQLLREPASPFVTDFINAQRGPFDNLAGKLPT